MNFMGQIYYKKFHYDFYFAILINFELGSYKPEKKEIAEKALKIVI